MLQKNFYQVIYAILVLLIEFKKDSAEPISGKPFPKDFKFGVATSAYQIEGGWNESGKGLGLWDYMTHQHPAFILDRTNGDVACDSYHKLDEDIAMLKNLGVDFYRFSISWSRIIPKGRVSDGVNLEGVEYYRQLLKKLEHAGIEAMVTLFHFDPPIVMHRENFLYNESLNVVYVDYARLAFELFGSKVKYWNTFNEPEGFCRSLTELNAARNPSTDCYTCAHNIIKCHSLVYRMYEEEFKEEYGGQVAIVLNTEWNEPATDLPIDQEAAMRKFLFQFGWFMHPLVFGDYPEVMKQRIRKYTFPLFPSRLPKFTEEDKKIITGAYDFIALNFYTPCLVWNEENNDFHRTVSKDMGIRKTFDPKWEKTSRNDTYVDPGSFRKILNLIYSTYHKPIFVTENGYVEKGIIEDDRRIYYLKTYLTDLLNSLYIDKIPILGYTTWSLMDNFEWTGGYTQKYGLYYVNFTTGERIPKKSVSYYKQITANRCLVDKCQEEDEKV